MALPKLTVMNHELTLPSSGEKISFRPFLVKEEKILMMAMQSEDTKDMINGLRQIIGNCVEGDINIDTLPTFDVEYIFLQLRSKSVGDHIEIAYESAENLCNDNRKCRFESVIDINNIKVEKLKGHTDLINITDKISIKLKYPQIEMNSALGNIENQDMVEVTFKMLAHCIEYIMDGEDMHKTSDYTEAEVDDFLNSLSSAQFKKIQGFFDTMPKLRQEIVSKCNKCGKEDNRVLEGLADFFASV